MATTMQKRTNKDSVQDVLASKEMYVSVSQTPAVTKLIWHIDPASLENEDDLKRKSPESKYLKIISACLTVMILWGIFWQVNNNLAPQLFSGSASAASEFEEGYTLAQIESNSFAFNEGDSASDLESSIGGRRAATKALLEVNAEKFAHRQTDETLWEGSLGSMLHRKLLSEIDHATTG